MSQSPTLPVSSSKPYARVSLIIDIPFIEKSIQLSSLFAKPDEIRAELTRQVKILYPSLHHELVMAYRRPESAGNEFTIFLVRLGDYRDAVGKSRPSKAIVQGVQLTSLPGVSFISKEVETENRLLIREYLTLRAVRVGALSLLLTSLWLAVWGGSKIQEGLGVAKVLHGRQTEFDSARQVYEREKASMERFQISQSAWGERLAVTPVMSTLASQSRTGLHLIRVEREKTGLLIEGMAVDERALMAYSRELGNALLLTDLVVNLVSSEKDGEDRVSFKLVVK